MSDPLPRLSAALADRYRIERELGQGGMATVYLAHDIKHDRKVAIKVLRPELAAVIGAERFLSEIKTTANLQHPHILPLFDSGITDSFLFYVMPYIEGETVRDRLNREKQLPISDAVRIATEVAAALDYAHRHNVIHRDIKPENILLHDGSALVADFGIALAASKAGGARMTETGMSLGTPHYMSPEQAMGERELTARSDVYALGAMLYEMLVGDPPFTGSTAQAIVAKVVTEKPVPPSRQRETVPEAVEDAVLTALQKLPADRFGSAAEFAAALAVPSAPVVARVEPAVAPPRWSLRAPLPWMALAALATGAATLGWMRRPVGGGPGDDAVVRFELRATPAPRFAYPVMGIGTYLAISPDGRRIVYAGSGSAMGWSLFIRDLDELRGRELPGTAGAARPEFSPDGRTIVFSGTNGRLMKVRVDGTGLTTIVQLERDASNPATVTWISPHELVFARPTNPGGLWRVPAEGGEPRPFTELDSVTAERFQLAPVAADGGRLVFYTSSRSSNIDLRLGVIEVATARVRVLANLSGARVLGLLAGHLLYVRSDGALMAAPFDAKRLEAGTPIQVLDSVTTSGWTAPAALAANGTLAYQRGGNSSQLVLVDAAGRATMALEEPRAYAHPRFAPDGRRVAFEVQGSGAGEIWVADLAARTAIPLTREGINDRPEWSPDGRRVLYLSSRGPNISLRWQPADGSGEDELLLEGTEAIREAVMTPAADAIIYRTDTRERNRDILRLPLVGDRTPVPLLATVDDEKEPRVSPDGRWLAYVANTTGTEEVYVRPLAGGGGRVAVSSGGGGEPLWAPDGRRIYYRTGAWLVQARLTGAPALAVAGRDSLFEGAYTIDIYHPNYDVTPDGTHFLMVRPVEADRQVVVVLNWADELRARLRGTP